MKSEDIAQIWKWAMILVGVLIICITLNDSYEKKLAFEKGMCQEMAVGSQAWKWQKCR